MANGKILYSNIADTGTLTVTNENSSYPKENIYNNNVKSKFKTTTITENTITWDMGSATAINGIAIFNHSQPDTTFVFECSTDNFSSTEYSETLSVADIKSLVDVDWNYRYYRIRMQDSANIQSIGEVFLFADSYEFIKNYNKGYSGGKKRQFKFNVGSSGRIIRRLEFEKFIYSMNFAYIDETQKDKFEEIGSDLYVVFMPDGTNFYYGVLMFDIPVNVTNGNYFNMGVNFEENV